jgi:hypothetical protein
MCGGPGLVLGTLGNLTWFSCRQCGWEFSTDQPIDLDDEDDGVLYDDISEDPLFDTDSDW